MRKKVVLCWMNGTTKQTLQFSILFSTSSKSDKKPFGTDLSRFLGNTTLHREVVNGPFIWSNAYAAAKGSLMNTVDKWLLLLLLG